MATFKININADPIVKYVNALEKLNKSVLPSVIKGTLNDAAFFMKKKSLPKVASKTFKERQSNFFKANSRVEMASGSDINTMASTVGMASSGLHNSSTNYAVKDLEQQESGGLIKHKTFIAEKGARSGKGMVRGKFRLDQLKPNAVIKAKRQSKSPQGKRIVVSQKQAFVRAALIAKITGVNYVLGNRNPNGNRTLSIINSISSNSKSHKLVIHRSALYSVKGGRATKVKRTDFMKRAANEAHLTMESSFIKRAQSEFKKSGVAG